VEADEGERPVGSDRAAMACLHDAPCCSPSKEVCRESQVEMGPINMIGGCREAVLRLIFATHTHGPRR